MPHCVDTPYSAHTPRILDIVAVRFVDRENIRITGNHDVLMDRETNLARSLSVDRVWIHHMVKPATHAVAVLVLELDGEVPPVRTIGAHPEVTLRMSQCTLCSAAVCAEREQYPIAAHLNHSGDTAQRRGRWRDAASPRA